MNDNKQAADDTFIYNIADPVDEIKPSSILSMITYINTDSVPV